MTPDTRSTSARLAEARMRLATYAQGLDHEDRSLRALEAVMGDSPDVMRALLDAMSTDDLDDLQRRASTLAKEARSEWLNRTRRPAGER